jgi:DNA-binding NtrC family response regulator
MPFAKSNKRFKRRPRLPLVAVLDRRSGAARPAGGPAAPHPVLRQPLLPRVRNGSLVTTRVDPVSDLVLERLVGACEQTAIREALRRTGGNKSQAARLLGLSRNGLAIKMERYALKT